MKKTSKLLIVDDDERNIFALKAVLHARGYTCVSTTGGLQALAVLKEDATVDAVLVDMMMPEIDGYSLMGLIRQTAGHEGILLIAVTAQAMPGDREKCLAAGADDYISKPVDIDKLVAILDQLTPKH